MRTQSLPPSFPAKQKTYRRRLVQQQNGRLLDNGPRNRQPLLLSATDVDAPFGQVRLVTITQVHDEIVRMCGLSIASKQLLRNQHANRSDTFPKPQNAVV